jgi:two-component system, OmpR family, phosphate regulon sensor histidine kinase PhoR
VLSLSFGYVGGALVGACVAAFGFGWVAIAATHTLSSVDTLADNFSVDSGDHSLFKHHGVSPIEKRLSDQESAIRLAKAQVETMRASWDLLPESIVLLDAAQRILWANSRAKSMMGIDRETHHLSPLTLAFREPRLTAAFQSNFETPLETPSPIDNARVLSFQGIRNKSDGWLLIASDITANRKVENMRRDFIGNIAHELKTPLTVLAGFTETMQICPDLAPDEREEVLGHMKEQTDAMQRLVSDLLSLSRLESDDAHAPFNSFALLPVLQRAYASASATVDNPCEIRIETEHPWALFGVEDEVASAVTNLAVNAVRHTQPSGTITIRVSTPKEGGCEIAVIDTGTGIAEQHLPRLTERFYRVDRGRSRKNGGTGLGLAIVKHIMVRHEGTLSITSEIGWGSVFTLIFPENRVDSTAIPAAQIS